MHLANNYNNGNRMISLGSTVYWQEENDVKMWHVGKETPILLQNVKLGDRAKIISSADLQRAVIWEPHSSAELFDIKKEKRLRLLISNKEYSWSTIKWL